MKAWFGKDVEKKDAFKASMSGTESKEGTMKFRVSTQSVYGPLGYIIHVNSTFYVLKKYKAFMYVDDIYLVYSH